MPKKSEAKSRTNGAKRKAGVASSGVASGFDGKLAGRAVEKYCSGEEPTTREAAALRRVERRREEDQRWEYYRSIPKRHWVEMSGRKHQVLKDQADKCQIPFGLAVIDLPVVVRAFHDFLGKNWRKLYAPDSEEEMLFGESSPALERYRLARAKREEQKLAEDQRNLISRERVHDGISRIATALRTAGEVLQRRFGMEAHEIIIDALEAAEREGEKYFGSLNGEKIK